MCSRILLLSYRRNPTCCLACRTPHHTFLSDSPLQDDGLWGGFLMLGFQNTFLYLFLLHNCASIYGMDWSSTRCTNSLALPTSSFPSAFLLKYWEPQMRHTIDWSSISKGWDSYNLLLHGMCPHFAFLWNGCLAPQSCLCMEMPTRGGIVFFSFYVSLF